MTSLLGRFGFFAVYLYGCLVAPLSGVRFVVFVAAATVIYIYTITMERKDLEAQHEQEAK